MALLKDTENSFSSIANILLIIGAGGAFNSILKASGLADSMAVLLSHLHMHPILLAWLVALLLHRSWFCNSSYDGSDCDCRTYNWRRAAGLRFVRPLDRQSILRH